MKRVIIGILLLSAAAAFGQIEKGDTEISFMGYFATFVGEDVDANGMGSLQLSYGKYVTPFLQFGVAPTVSFYTFTDFDGETSVKAEFSGSVFAHMNLARASRIIPYLTAQYYQFTFDIPEDAEFTDFGYANVGMGFKNFINEYASFNVLATYGFSMAPGAEGGIIMVMTGLSIIF
ncbi:MAG TPA: hypothetical protein ENN03_00855 [bacterium]|nr:hypothetical protein [bacterium]